MKLKYLLLFIVFLFFSTNVYAKHHKNILILNSYHKGFQWSDDIIDGIEEVFYDTDIDTTTLYMDAKRITSHEYYKEIGDIYKLQLKDRKYDLVIAIDRFAYNFVLQYYPKLFTDELLFFVGIEKYSNKKLMRSGLQKKTSGLLEKRAISDIVKTIYKMMPNIKTLHIINDNSASGDDTEPYIYNAINEITGKFEVNYIKKTNLEELTKKFSLYRPNEAVFFVRFYNNKPGNLYKNSEIAAMIDSSEIPVFVTDNLFTGNGPVGGKIIPIKELGIRSAKMVLAILEGRASTSYIKTDDTYKYEFDYEKIKKFGLDPTRLKRKITYINKPISFFDKYRQFINFIFLIFPFFLLLSGILIYNLYFRLKNSKLLQARMEFDKALLNIIENPIVWQDKDGKIIESNSKFLDMMQFPCPHTKELKLDDYLKKSDSTSLIQSLDKFIINTSISNELILKNKDDKEFIYYINHKEYLEDLDNSGGSVTVFTDITKERHAQLEKDKQQDFIIQQSKLAEIGEIFSSIAHQWKTPLVEISTIAQEHFYMESPDKEALQKDHRYVDDIMRQVKYMTETINDFQTFIMPSNRKTIFDINDAVVKMMSIVEHNIKYNYINVKIKVEDNTNLMINGYKNELMQTLLNIVNNAKEVLLKNRKKREGNINITIKNVDYFVQIDIEDNGGGVKKEYIDKIFDPYFTTKKDGHGIGLYMARLIIEDKMNGTIAVSNTNEGAKFSIKLEVSNENISS